MSRFSTTEFTEVLKEAISSYYKEVAGVEPGTPYMDNVSFFYKIPIELSLPREAIYDANWESLRRLLQIQYPSIDNIISSLYKLLCEKKELSIPELLEEIIKIQAKNKPKKRRVKKVEAPCNLIKLVG